MKRLGIVVMSFLIFLSGCGATDIMTIQYEANQLGEADMYRDAAKMIEAVGEDTVYINVYKAASVGINEGDTKNRELKKEEVIELLMNAEAHYWAARTAGYSITKKEYYAGLKEQMKEMQDAEEWPELENALLKAGIDMDTVFKVDRRAYERNFTVNRWYEGMVSGYWNGQRKIGDETYDDLAVFEKMIFENAEMEFAKSSDGKKFRKALEKSIKLYQSKNPKDVESMHLSATEVFSELSYRYVTDEEEK